MCAREGLERGARRGGAARWALCSIAVPPGRFPYEFFFGDKVHGVTATLSSTRRWQCGATLSIGQADKLVNEIGADSCTGKKVDLEKSA